MSDTETKRTRRAASYPGAVAWIVANANAEAVQADPDLWAQFVSDVFKRDLTEVTADLNAGLKASAPATVPEVAVEPETATAE